MGLRHHSPTPQGAAVVAVASPGRHHLEVFGRFYKLHRGGGGQSATHRPPRRWQRLEKPSLLWWSRRNSHATRLWCVGEAGEDWSRMEMKVCGGCDDDIDGGMMMMMMMEVVLWWAAVGRQPEEVEARGGE
ncbi:hypothetical protein Tco_1135119 [Tanacetum coccineum]